MFAFLPFFFDVSVLLFLILIRVTLSFGSTVLTATIDDTDGDSVTGAQPVYSGNFSPNSDCDGCTVHPDPTQAHDGTWHDSSQFNGAGPVSVTLSFTGTGISVFCILANTIPSALTTTDLAFTLDGSPQQAFSHNPDSTSDYEYNAQVFSMGGLIQGAHQLVVATNNPSGSLLLFDYAEYTYEVADPTTAVQVTNTATNTVTQIAEVTTTATDTQNIAVPQASTTSAHTHASSPPSSSSHSGSTSTLPGLVTPSLVITGSSATAGNSSISTLPIISTGTSASSSEAPPMVALSKKFNYIPVLVGTLIPVVLIVILSVLLCRRRRARHAIIPYTESQLNGSAGPLFGSRIAFNHPSSQQVTGSYQPTITNGADNAPLEWSPPSSHFDGSSATYATARDIHMGEKCMRDSGGPFSDYRPSPSPANDSGQPSSPPATSVHTFETCPPPMYSERRPLPSVFPA